MKASIKTHLKKYWFTYLLAIAVAILLFMLLNPGKPVVSNKYEQDVLNQRYKDLRDSMHEVNRRDSIQTKVIISQDSAIRSIRSANEATRKKLDKSKSNSQRLAKEIKQAQPEDTSMYAKKVDSLIAENQNLIWLNDQYVEEVQSLNKKVDEQKATYEEKVNDKVKLIADMGRAAAQSNTAYNKLSVQNDKTGKRLTTQKVITKSLVVVVLVETAIIILKK